MDLFKKTFQKSKFILSRPVADKMIIIPTSGKKRDLEKIYALSGSGVRIWGLLDGRKSLSRIRDLMLREFDVTSAQLEKDMVSFIEDLEDKKFITEGAGNKK